MTYEFQFRYDGWIKRRLDEGFREVTSAVAGTPKTYESMKDDDGNPLTEPRKLDGEGHKLKSDEDPVYNEYNIYRSTDFSVLDIEYANLFLTY